ncbi:hypothetical protein VTI74DRAFT_9203 [Chaetomium olivicolor]
MALLGLSFEGNGEATMDIRVPLLFELQHATAPFHHPSQCPPGPPPTRSAPANARLTDYFHFWRKGERLKDAIARIKFPANGRWPGLERKEARARHRARRIESVWAEPGPNILLHYAISANALLISRMKVAGFASKKIPGRGGLGVASLFEAIEGRRREDVDGEMKVEMRIDTQEWAVNMFGSSSSPQMLRMERVMSGGGLPADLRGPGPGPTDPPLQWEPEEEEKAKEVGRTVGVKRAPKWVKEMVKGIFK